MENNELQHHGIKGMKWGVRRTPSQLGHPSSSSKKSGGSSSLKQFIADRKKKKEAAAKAAAKAKAQQEKADAEKQKQDFEEAKTKALKSGSASDVLRFKGQISNQELQNALNRINMERQLAEISSKETKSGMDKVSNLMNKVEQGRQAVEKGIGAYNTVSKIINTFTDADLPQINGESKAKQAANAAKEKLIKSGSPSEISKHFGSFTGKELEDINKRFNYEDKIKDRIPKPSNTTSTKSVPKNVIDFGKIRVDNLLNNEDDD